MIGLWCFLGSCLVLLPLAAFTPHIEELQHVPSPIQKYHLVDLGETDVPLNRLTRLQKGYSFAPSINNNAQMTWNSVEGGRFKSLKKEVKDFLPKFEGMRLYIMGLNDAGDLLVGIERGFESFEWLLWPFDGTDYLDREHIHTLDPFSPDLILCDFNNERQVVGFYRKEGTFEPALWNLSQGLKPLGQSTGLKVQGKARAINDKNTIVGLYEEQTVCSPFIWNPETGFEVMRNYRDKLFPVGWMEFSDILITSDDVVYGNYWLKHGAHDDLPKGVTPYYGFVWNPGLSKIDQLELEGMRITDINDGHTLVGIWKGHAAIRERDRRPVSMESLLSVKELEGWELIEATAINNDGTIVGYGTYQGKTHNFMAEPL